MRHAFQRKSVTRIFIKYVLKLSKVKAADFANTLKKDDVATDFANRFEKDGGVYTKSGERVPLTGVKIQADVYGFVADVMTNLTFVSKYEDPIEVKLVLPLDVDSAVYRVESFCKIFYFGLKSNN